MAETYLITAKTVAEAIEVAKREYEDATHEISYEIVQMEKKGLFGLIGAKDAQIKVTVSKVLSVQSELGSLVADIKSLKTVTDRGDAPAPVFGSQNQNAGQQKKSQNQPKQEKQQNQPRQEKQQNQPKQEKQQNQPKQEKQQNQPKQEKQQNQQKQEKQQNQPKQEKQQNQPKQEKQQNQPKQEKQQNQPKQEKQQNQPRQDRQQNQPKQEKPAEKPLEKQPEKPLEKPEESAAGFGSAESTYRSALGNQAKPSRRGRQKKAKEHTDELSAAVTVSAPVGLTDFVSETPTEGFGSESVPSGGRMNNDIRRKNRQQTPAQPQQAAEAAESAEKKEASSQQKSRSRSRNNRSGDRRKPETEAPRYDIAETDEDYEKLDRLVAEEDAAEAVRNAPAEPVREERRREAITQAEMDYALEFANTLLKNMQLDARAIPADCPEGEEFDVTEEANVYPKIDIVGDDTGILIGHHGETLDSIQYLVNLSALRKTKSKDGDYVKIVVDIENYRQKREETLRTLARRMAARAVKYRRNVFLEPMNAYERRIIHSELQNYEGVSTHSVGADRDRKIIVTYEGPDKQPDRNRRRKDGEGDAVSQPTREAGETREGQGRRSRRGRGRGGESRPVEVIELNTAEEVLETEAEHKERRRPRKQPKMSIEQLTEWLPDAGEETPRDEEDTLNVMSGLRAAAEEAQAEAEDAKTAAQDAVEEAEESFESRVNALLESLGNLGDDGDGK